MTKCVAVAMSGGVDSSVTAALLKEQGYDVIGITLRLWEEDPSCPAVENVHSCCSLSAVDDAKAVASVIGIPHYTLDYRELFRNDVIDYFVQSYVKGQTPNPCIACNKYIKFGLLWQQAQQFGAQYLATGHYARIVYNEARGIYELLRGTDRRKDQSYVLYQLTQDLLPHIVFPMAELEKVQTRELAKQFGLPVFNKPESQDICFIPDNDYKGFLKKRVPQCFKPGNFVDVHGHVVGRHQGIPCYTIGQPASRRSRRSVLCRRTRCETQPGHRRFRNGFVPYRSPGPGPLVGGRPAAGDVCSIGKDTLCCQRISLYGVSRQGYDARRI